MFIFRYYDDKYKNGLITFYTYADDNTIAAEVARYLLREMRTPAFIEQASMQNERLMKRMIWCIITYQLVVRLYMIKATICQYQLVYLSGLFEATLPSFTRAM